MTTIKCCFKCKESKNITEFSKNQTYCKLCTKEIKKNFKNTILLKKYICSKCGEEKENFEFYKALSTRGVSSYCKNCSFIYQSDYDYKYYFKQKRSDRLKWFHDFKSNKPCIDCNQIFVPTCMDYDHLKDKVKNISRMVLDNTPKNIIIKEINKCELVCVFCHNKRTFNRVNRIHKIKNNSIIIREKKNVPCNICGKQYEHYNMQFDHLDGYEKFKNVCQLINYKTSTVLDEINKCQVLCVMCHRLKSIQEQQLKYTIFNDGY